jgi:hypothetical protein
MGGAQAGNRRMKNIAHGLIWIKEGARGAAYTEFTDHVPRHDRP